DQQSLIDRRIANRQAESLKGYGYKAGGTIIGSRTRIINEIDQRKVGKDPETNEIEQRFQKILKMDYEPLDEFIVIFKEREGKIEKPELKPKVVLQPQSEKAPQIKIKNVSEVSQISPEKEVKKKEIFERKEAPLEHASNIKKAEFSFESQVKELPSPELESTQKELVSIKEAIKSSVNLNDIIPRIEKIETKIDKFIREFQEFKTMYEKNRKL
ncbi:MAG: hypothetical protein ACFFAO_14050, partial [Candidatus Hermodarchaeota archaeon]